MAGPDNVTVGEVARRVDDVRGDIRELTKYMREHVEALPVTYVPRAEVDARLSAADKRADTTAAAVRELKRDQVSGLRAVLLAAAAAMPGVGALLVSLVKH